MLYEVITRFVATYKDSLQGIVNECIGFNNQLMVADKPESLLTNFVSDLMLSEAGIIADSLGISVPDLAIMNVYGLRDVLPQGDVTVGTIFRVMPFENKLVFVKMTGDNLNLLLNHIASKGGEGMSGISFGIKDRKAVQVMVQGKPLDPGKIYVLAVRITSYNVCYTKLLRAPQQFLHWHCTFCLVLAFLVGAIWQYHGSVRYGRVYR